MKTAPKGIKTNTLDTIRMSATPPRRELCSRMRSGNSSVTSIYRTTLATGGPDSKMMDLRQNPYVKYRWSSANLTLQEKSVGYKNVMSGRWRRCCSSVFTTWTSGLQSSLRGRTTISLSEKMMHTLSTTPTAMLWSSRRWWPITMYTGS